MTDFTKIITNTLNVLGPSVPQVWGTAMTWGTSKWGVTGDLMITFVKGITDTLTHTSTIARSVTYNKIMTDTFSLASSIQKSFFKESTNSISLATDIPTLTLILDDLWSYIFASTTANAAGQVLDSFSRVSDPSTTQTQTTDPSTTWTDA